MCKFIIFQCSLYHIMDLDLTWSTRHCTIWISELTYHSYFHKAQNKWRNPSKMLQSLHLLHFFFINKEHHDMDSPPEIKLPWTLDFCNWQTSFIIKITTLMETGVIVFMVWATCLHRRNKSCQSIKELNLVKNWKLPTTCLSSDGIFYSIACRFI